MLIVQVAPLLRQDVVFVLYYEVHVTTEVLIKTMELGTEVFAYLKLLF